MKIFGKRTHKTSFFFFILSNKIPVPKKCHLIPYKNMRHIQKPLKKHAFYKLFNYKLITKNSIENIYHQKTL